MEIALTQIKRHRGGWRLSGRQESLTHGKKTPVKTGDRNMSREIQTDLLPRLQARYAQRGQEGRSRMLDELCQEYHYERKYAIKLLEGKPSRPKRPPGPTLPWPRAFFFWSRGSVLCALCVLSRLRPFWPVWMRLRGFAFSGATPTARRNWRSGRRSFSPMARMWNWTVPTSDHRLGQSGGKEKKQVSVARLARARR